MMSMVLIARPAPLTSQPIVPGRVMSDSPARAARSPAGFPPGSSGRLEDLLRAAGGDLLDIDAALRAGHEHRHADGAVEHHTDVDFALDVGRLLHEYLRHFLACVAGLFGYEGILEHDVGDLSAFLAGANELDTAEVGAGVLEAPFAA